MKQSGRAEHDARPRAGLRAHARATAAMFVVAMFVMGSDACARDSPTRRVPRMTLRTTLRTTTPDELPALATTALPFKYPAALYARKVQGNVTLSLFIDRDGRVLAESTRVNEASGFAAFDSAAIAGASELRFAPAKLRGEPMPFSILFPVYFRHPEARPLPGDTILNDGKPG